MNCPKTKADSVARKSQLDVIEEADEEEAAIDSASGDEERTLAVLRTYFTTDEKDETLASAAMAIGRMCNVNTTDLPLSAVSEIRYVNPQLQMLRKDVHEFAHYIQAGILVDQYLTVDSVDSRGDSFV